MQTRQVFQPFQCFSTIPMLFNHSNAFQPFQCFSTIPMFVTVRPAFFGRAAPFFVHRYSLPLGMHDEVVDVDGQLLGFVDVQAALADHDSQVRDLFRSVPIETSRKYFKHELQQNARTKRFFSP
jgi:hypothetical protein